MSDENRPGYRGPRWTDIHHKVNGSEFLDAAVHGALDTFELAHVDSADADDLSPRASRGNVPRRLFGLLDIAAYNTGIGA